VRDLTWNRSFTLAFPFPFLFPVPPNKPSAERKSGISAAVEMPAPQTTTIRLAVRILLTTVKSSGSQSFVKEPGVEVEGVDGPETERGRGMIIVILSSTSYIYDKRRYNIHLVLVITLCTIRSYTQGEFRRRWIWIKGWSFPAVRKGYITLSLIILLVHQSALIYSIQGLSPSRLKQIPLIGLHLLYLTFTHPECFFSFQKLDISLPRAANHHASITVEEVQDLPGK